MAKEAQFDAGAFQSWHDLSFADVLLVPRHPQDVLGEDQQNSCNFTPTVSVQEDNGEDRDGAESDGAVFFSIPSGLETAEETDTDHAPPPAADDGLGEVSAKYRIVFCALC